jgi:hypothetical protein
MTSRYARLSRDELAVLVPELLLIGHLIDRAGMAYALAEWGADEMTQIAVEEWMAASPIYTKRMQRALRFEGDDVITIFKGMQLEIGAPPQFMDFRYTVTDRYHGTFQLDHCGALLDVEPMGDVMVTNMCHHIEDPTFDATALPRTPGLGCVRSIGRHGLLPTSIHTVPGRSTSTPTRLRRDRAPPWPSSPPSAPRPWSFPRSTRPSRATPTTAAPW